jgi:hypothetical protein
MPLAPYALRFGPGAAGEESLVDRVADSPYPLL